MVRSEKLMFVMLHAVAHWAPNQRIVDRRPKFTWYEEVNLVGVSPSAFHRTLDSEFPEDFELKRLAGSPVSTVNCGDFIYFVIETPDEIGSALEARVLSEKQ